MPDRSQESIQITPETLRATGQAQEIAAHAAGEVQQLRLRLARQLCTLTDAADLPSVNRRPAGVDPVSWITDYVEDALNDAQQRLERQAACHVLGAIAVYSREDGGWLEDRRRTDDTPSHRQ